MRGAGGSLRAVCAAIGAFVLSGCAGSKHDLGSPAAAWAPAPGATYADSSEQVRVVLAIRAMDNLRKDRCTERRVSDTVVLDSMGFRADSDGAAGAAGGNGGAAGAGDGNGVAGAADGAGPAGADPDTALSRLPRHERWTIDRCGKQVSYLVEFAPADSGRVAITVRFQ